mmetsp:Transcript_41802/g.37225  ORF Transcript_41802/g.37225 Transcript_41802/m.37225 type:complete len:140 (-) Transcript_41802:558-977(-)
MTKDNLNAIVDAVIFFRIENTAKSQFNIGNVLGAITELTQTSIRDALGMVTLQQALEDRDRLAGHIREAMQGPTDQWGVTVTRCLIQEMLFAPELVKPLSTAATARRQAESKIIGARADVKAANLMSKAAAILDSNPAM